MNRLNWKNRIDEDLIPHASWKEYSEEMERRDNNTGTAILGLGVIITLAILFMYVVVKLGEWGLITP